MFLTLQGDITTSQLLPHDDLVSCTAISW